MAKKKERRRYHCRHPECTRTRPFDHPQQVIAHRVKVHGEPWPTSKEGRALRAKKANGALPTRPKMAKAKPRRDTPYRQMLKVIPTPDLAAELVSRTREA